MSLHDFQLDDKIFRQKEGGSIGLDLTGVVSDIFMSYWDKKLLDRMAENGLEAIVYKRYKDDVNVVIEERVNGANVVGDVENSEQRERRLMDRMQQLAEGIDESI